MSPLLVEVDGRVLRLESDSVLRIGRAIEADVVLTAGSVSRHHAELRPVGGSWVLVDTGSQFGTYVDGRRISEYPVSGRLTVQCGPDAPGSTLTIVPEELATAELSAPGYAPAPPPPAELLDEPTMPPRQRQPQPPPAAAPAGSPGPAPAFPPPAPGGGTAPRPAPPSGGAPPIPPELDQTQVLAGPLGVPRAGAPAPPRSGPDLLIVAEGREHRFRHPAQITIGRLPDSTVVIMDPACSRQHGRVGAVPGGWVYTNVSNEGTFLDGRRITGKKFDERTELRLGHPVAGPKLTLVPILSAAEEERRIARRRMRRRLAVLGVVAAVLVLVVGVTTTAVLLAGDDDPAGDETAGATSSETASDGDASSMTELTDAELDSAKAATVKIIAESHLLADPDQEVQYAGSGSIIRSDGLILTNAHVAAPESPGLIEQYGPGDAIADPEYLLVSLTDGMTDTNSPPEYRARVVAADGDLDAAVIEVYADAEGNELTTEPDLPTVPLGTSEDLRAGDDVTVLGFPAVAGSGDSITVTTGVISTVLSDPTLGPRSELDTDARIAPGNSGGMAINNDAELIGIPTAIQFDRTSPVTSGRIRSIDVVKPLIETAEAQTS